MRRDGFVGENKKEEREKEKKKKKVRPHYTGKYLSGSARGQS